MFEEIYDLLLFEDDFVFQFDFGEWRYSRTRSRPGRVAGQHCGVIIPGPIETSVWTPIMSFIIIFTYIKMCLGL